MSELEEYLEFAKGLANEAGKIHKRYFAAEEIGMEIKADNSPVTLADKEVNELVIQKVKEHFPDHGVMGEEDSFGLDRSNLWIVDPLDGTADFAKGIPLFAFSMALVSRGQLKIAVVYAPMSGRLLWASRGGGAFENGKKLEVSNNEIPKKLKIASWVVGGIENSVFTDKSVHKAVIDAYAQAGNIELSDPPVAYAIAVVGAGTLDAEVSSIKTPWDVAAGSLIAMEAGAKVTDLFGQPVDRWDKDANGILVAAPAVHSYLLNIIQPALKESR